MGATMSMCAPMNAPMVDHSFGGDQPLVWAHRGASVKAPENTLASFRQGLEDGADGIEIDVHLSSDGRIVVIHDNTVDRTTDGSGRVINLSMAEIKRLNASAKHPSKSSEECVPSLEEVLELVFGWPGPSPRRLLIELKGPHSGLPQPFKLPLSISGKETPVYESMTTALQEALAPYSKYVADNCIVVQSFYKPYLDELRVTMPELSLVYLSLSSCRGCLESEDLQGSDLGFAGVAVRHTTLTKESVDKLRRRHRFIFAWTVDEAVDMQRMCKLGITGIITNKPDSARRVVNGLACANSTPKAHL